MTMEMMPLAPPVELAACAPATAALETKDAAKVSSLDLEFQAAVKRNDAETIDRILHPRYLLVLGDGTRITRDELLAEARNRTVEYEIQDEDPGTQSVMVWGDTAVVTARLRIKGSRAGRPFDRTLWFTDTYVRTHNGWRYAYAQASLPLPAAGGAVPLEPRETKNMIAPPEQVAEDPSMEIMYRVCG